MTTISRQDATAAVAANPHRAALALEAALRFAETKLLDLRPGSGMNSERSRLVAHARAMRRALGLADPALPAGEPYRYAVSFWAGASSGSTSYATWAEAQTFLRTRARNTGYVQLADFERPAPRVVTEWQSVSGAAFRVEPMWPGDVDHAELAVLGETVREAEPVR